MGVDFLLFVGTGPTKGRLRPPDPDTTCRGFSFIKRELHPWTVLEVIFHQKLPLEAEEREGQLHREISPLHEWWVTEPRA